MSKDKSMNDFHHKSQSEKRRSGEPLKNHFMTTSSDKNDIADKLILSDVTKNALARKKQDEQIDKANEYNRNIFEIDERYSKDIEMVGNQLIIRMMCIPPVNKSGIFTDIGKIKVPKAKPGDFDYVDNPWPYKNVGVLVNIPSGIEGYEVGDLVQVDVRVIVPQVGREGNLILPTEFVLYNADDLHTYGSDWGYIAITPRDIVCKIKKYHG